MSRRFWNILIGIGSVLDMYTSTDYSKYMREINHSPRKYGSFHTDAINLHRDWVKIGDDFRHAIRIVGVEKIEKS
jgi:hypothetical protein